MKRNSLLVVLKPLEIFINLAISKIEVRIEGKLIKRNPVLKIGISPTFWRIDNCYQCGLCCCGFGLIFLSQGNIPSGIKAQVLEKVISINNKKIKIGFYRQKHIRNDTGCDLLYGEIGKIKSCLCTINNQKPLHCALPHIRVFRNNLKESSILVRSQFGRNWAIGCPVKFGEQYSKIQFEKDQILLKSLLYTANYLGVETKLSELIKVHSNQGLLRPKKVIYV